MPIEKRALNGTILGFLSFFINSVHSIILVPFFLTYWGEVKYGLFIGIYAFIQLMRGLDTGHQIYIGNQFNLFHYSNKERAYKTLASSIGIALLIGFAELLIFIAIWKLGYGGKIIGLEITQDNSLFIGITSMLVMWWLVGSVGGILSRAIVAKGLFPQAIMFSIFIKIVEIIVLGIAIMGQISLSSLFIGLAVINFIFSLIVLYWIYKKMPEYYPWWKGYDFKLGASNFSKSIVLTINSFLEQFNSTGLIFMVSQYLSTAFIPIFTTVRTLSNTMSQVANIIIQPLVPEMIRFHGEEKKTKIVKVIQTNWFFSGLLINIGFLVLIPMAESLYSLWTNHRLQLDQELFYLLILSVVFINYGRSLSSYLTGINDLKAISAITFTRTAIIFSVSVVLISKYGLSAIGLGILIAEIGSSILLPILYVKSHLRDDFLSLKQLFFYGFPVFAVLLAVLLCYLFDHEKMVICSSAIMLMAMLYYWQWTELDSDIKAKLMTLIEKYRTKTYGNKSA